MGRLAILSGAGALPLQLADRYPDAMRVVFHGVEHPFDGEVSKHRFEKMGGLFDSLKTQGVTQVVLAGSMARPPLDPGAFDPTMAEIAPRLVAALQGGDDALLRLVISLFEERGFGVIGAHELLPEITAKDGFLIGQEPDETALTDMARATDILLALSPLDVGQGAVVSAGLCLGIETLQGTDAMLAFVADTPEHLRRATGGVLVKAPKQGQDLRVDMPAIGPMTVKNAARAGLSGIVIAAGKVLILDRDATFEAIESTGLFLTARVL